MLDDAERRELANALQTALEFKVARQSDPVSYLRSCRDQIIELAARMAGSLDNEEGDFGAVLAEEVDKAVQGMLGRMRN